MKLLSALAFALAATAFTPASAANLAIFGNNNIATLYGASNTVTLVTDAQLATPGFLNTTDFDAFVYTREGFSFGVGLSAAAAANIDSYVTGNIVLFNGDFQDDIGFATTDLLFNQALAFVLSGSGGGYIGEYRGSFAAFASNDYGNNPIGLVNGNASVSGGGQGGSDGEVQVTAVGLASPVTAGVPFPYNPGAVEFGATVTGVNPAGVLAVFDNGNPAIIANSREDISIPTPAPAALALFGLGVLALGAARRR